MRSGRILVALLLLGLLAGCGLRTEGKPAETQAHALENPSAGDPGDGATLPPGSGEVAFDATGTTSRIDNLYLPLPAGTTVERQGAISEGTERVVSFVSHDTRIVAGVESAILVERTWVDDEFVSERFEYFTQDADGNVWKMGESAQALQDGIEIGPAEGWEAGTAGAQPVLRMAAAPEVGDVYEPGDHAEIVKAVDVEVTLSDGSSHLCVETEIPGENTRYYSPGFGVVLEANEERGEHLELVDLEEDADPRIDPAEFTPEVTNPLFPLPPGTTWLHEGDTEDGLFTSQTTVTDRTRLVMGVECREVEVYEQLDGELSDVSVEWYAQDALGNVWYFGEDTREYKDGVVVSTEGSWEAGVDGGKPGIVMKANPRIGDSYRQEYHPTQAEDVAHVIAKDVLVTLSDGSTHLCLETEEEDTVEEDDGEREKERKFHAPGLGMVRATQEDGSQPIDLVKVERR